MKKLNNEEFENLIQRLSQLQDDGDGISAEEIAGVFSEDPELLKAYITDNFEKSNKQKSQDARKRQRKNGLIINLVLLGLAIPLSLFGGYKLRETIARFVPISSEQEELQAQLDAQKEDIKSLETEKAELEQEVENSEKRIDELISQIGSATNGSNDKPVQKYGTTPGTETETLVATSSTNPGSKTTTHPTNPEEVGADTPSGSILQAGQTWAEDGIVMTLTDPSVKPGCENGLVQFNLTLSNFSGKDQIVRFSGNDLAIDVDSAFSSNYWWTYNAAARNNCNTERHTNPEVAKTRLIPYQSLEIEDLNDGETVELYLTFFGDLESFDQTIKFHLEKAGPIEKAKWLINPLPQS